jgi:hypothetical protein
MYEGGQLTSFYRKQTLETAAGNIKAGLKEEFDPVERQMSWTNL